MACGQGARQGYSRVLSAMVTHKQESLQYLTVDSDTYIHWRTLARSLELATDCEVASFLLQHYEKTSAIPLTQCVKCCGPLVQYCVPCNIYMSQPTASSSALLEQEGVGVVASGDEAVMSGQTILIDFTDVEPTCQSVRGDSSSQQLVMVKTDDLGNVDMSEARGEVMSSNQLQALVEACAMQGAIVTETPVTGLEHHTTTTATTTTATKSLLTPEVLRKLKSQSVCSGAGSQVNAESLVVGGESFVTVTSGELHPLTDSLSVTLAPQQAVTGVPGVTLKPVMESSLSEDESDIYCAPLFKREHVDDEDLQMAINVLEGKVIAGDLQLPADVKVAEDATQVSFVGQTAGAETESCHADEHTNADEHTDCVDVHVSPAIITDLETSQSAALGEKTDAATSSEVEASEWTAPELDPSDATNTHPEESKPPPACSADWETASQHASPEKPTKTSGRKRKRRPDSPDPNSSPQNGTTPAVSHTMRTRFFDKKRPSFAPGSSSPQPPSPSKTVCGRKRGRKVRKETDDEKQSRGRKKGVKEDGDYNPGVENDEAVDSEEDKGRKERGKRRDRHGGEKEKVAEQDGSSGQNPNADARFEADSTQEKKPDLKNQVRVITSQEDPQNLILPQTRLQHNTTAPNVRIKTKSGVGVAVKTETNVAPLEFDLPRLLSSQVSIVTDGGVMGEDPVPRKKQRKLQLKKVGKNYACDMCEEQMGSRGELKQHLLVQHGNRPYACHRCPATYKNRSHLRVHLNRHAEVKPFQCPHCPKNFASNYALTAHLTTHSTARPEVCDICGRSFKSAKYLKGHRLLHQPGEKRFICQQCGARFSRKSNLINHIKIHNDDKQFECPHCQRRFIQAGSLKSHVFRMHNPHRARPYVCEVCGAARYAKDQFDKHMMIHTGTKPFKCQVCGAAFVQSNALKGHMKIHTETQGKAHWCYMCGAAFKKFASLKKHCSKIHNEFPDMAIGTLQVIEVQIPALPSDAVGAVGTLE
ncbi:hypothetical protein ACOMHN_055349 [Nucella lapillus]